MFPLIGCRSQRAGDENESTAGGRGERARWLNNGVERGAEVTVRLFEEPARRVWIEAFPLHDDCQLHVAICTTKERHRLLAVEARQRSYDSGATIPEFRVSRAQVH